MFKSLITSVSKPVKKSKSLSSVPTLANSNFTDNVQSSVSVSYCLTTETPVGSCLSLKYKFSFKYFLIDSSVYKLEPSGAPFSSWR